MLNPRAILVAGLAYGDEAKGATTDFLCRQLPVDLVVRYNGGSQAAHNVVTPGGRHHTFAQFGAGMLADLMVRTHLSRFMLVDPLTMMNEAEELAKKTGGCWSRTSVDPRCVIITPFHKRLNRLREQARGQARHGSCGMGVGVAREWSLKYGDDVLYAGDLKDTTITLRKLGFLANLLMQEVGADSTYGESILELSLAYAQWVRRITIREDLPITDCCVFEGAQGVLLDETHGEAPHNTWTDCTFNNALTICKEAGITDITKIGCLRTYHTRHGAGPFNGVDVRLGPPELHNTTGEWQGEFRVGPFDWELARKALSIIGGVDSVALSHLDRVQGQSKDAFIRFFEQSLATPVHITADGMTANDRQFTEAWSG